MACSREWHLRRINNYGGAADLWISGGEFHGSRYPRNKIRAARQGSRVRVTEARRRVMPCHVWRSLFSVITVSVLKGLGLPHQSFLPTLQSLFSALCFQTRRVVQLRLVAKASDGVHRSSSTHGRFLEDEDHGSPAMWPGAKTAEDCLQVEVSPGWNEREAGEQFLLAQSKSSTTCATPCSPLFAAM